MAAWNAQNNPDGTALTSDQVVQHLQLGKESQATITVDSSYGNAVRTFVSGDVSHQEHTSAIGSKWIGADSNNYWELIHDGSISGTVATVTYSNLRHSYYTDKNGATHKITKIVRQFSNLTAYPNGVAGKLHAGGSPYWGNNAWLLVYSDPTDGWWVGNVDGVTITDQYYDDQGNLINFDGNAYLSANSLNACYWNGQMPLSLTGQKEHVEYVTPGDGTTSYELVGSSIKKHTGGSLYSNTTNNRVGLYGITDKSQTSWKDDSNWDNQNSSDFYYGSGLLALHGSKISYRSGILFDNNTGQDDNYFAPSTLIPTTPNPKTEVHYHYNQLNVNGTQAKTSEVHFHYDQLNVNGVPKKTTDAHYHYDVVFCLLNIFTV